MTVLQTIALPLGYSAIRMARSGVDKAIHARCQHLDFVSRQRGLNMNINLAGDACLGRKCVSPGQQFTGFDVCETSH